MYGQPGGWGAYGPPASLQPGGYGAPAAPTAWWSVYGNLPPHELSNMQAWFQSIDTDRSGRISAPELAQLRFFNQPLGLPGAIKFIQAFDKDRSGQIEFHEYAAMHGFINHMSNAFFAADRDRSGTLDWREIHPALQSAGFMLNAVVVQSLVMKFDKTRRGIVTYPDFLHIMAHLAHVRSIFEWNDPMRSGRASLTMEQLIHICTDVLV